MKAIQSVLIPVISHLGLVARKDNTLNVKKDIEVLQLARIAPDHSLVVRKAFRFFNCTPISMDSSNLTHDATGIQLYTTQWHYTNYITTFHGSDLTDAAVRNYLKKSIFSSRPDQGGTWPPRTTADHYAGASPRIETAREHMSGDISNRNDEPDRITTINPKKFRKVGVPMTVMDQKPGSVVGIDTLDQRRWQVTYPANGRSGLSKKGVQSLGFQRLDLNEIIRNITGALIFGGGIGRSTEGIRMQRSRTSYARAHSRDDPNRFTDDGAGFGFRGRRGGTLQKVKDIVDVIDIFF